MTASAPTRRLHLRNVLDACFTLRSPLGKRHFVVGMAGAAALLAFLALGFVPRETLPKGASFTLSVATGVALLGCIAYQWMLFFARLSGRAADAKRHWSTHRYVGTASILVFVLHAGALGYAMVSVMALAFLAVALTGLWNAEVLILRKPWLRTAWQFAHVGLSGLMMPLIALHAWAALAFK